MRNNNKLHPRLPLFHHQRRLAFRSAGVSAQSCFSIWPFHCTHTHTYTYLHAWRFVFRIRIGNCQITFRQLFVNNTANVVAAGAANTTTTTCNNNSSSAAITSNNKVITTSVNTQPTSFWVRNNYAKCIATHTHTYAHVIHVGVRHSDVAPSNAPLFVRCHCVAVKCVIFLPHLILIGFPSTFDAFLSTCPALPFTPPHCHFDCPHPPADSTYWTRLLSI